MGFVNFIISRFFSDLRGLNDFDSCDPAGQPNPEKIAPQPIPTPQTWTEAATTTTGLASRIGQYLWPEIIENSNQTKKDTSRLYSGTSFATLEKIIDSAGGQFDPTKTFFSDSIGFCFGYARSRAWRDRSPGIIIEVPAQSLDGRLALAHYQPSASDHKGYTVQLANFYQANAVIFVHELSEDTKQTILDWISNKEREQPQLAAFWNEKYLKFAAAFYP